VDVVCRLKTDYSGKSRHSSSQLSPAVLCCGKCSCWVAAVPQVYINDASSTTAGKAMRRVLTSRWRQRRSSISWRRAVNAASVAAQHWHRWHERR